LKLQAASPQANDTGYFVVPIVSYGVAVTPDGATASQRIAGSSGNSENFTVQNTGTAQNTYNLLCPNSANVTCTGLTIDGNSASSVTLAGGNSKIVVASYSVGAVGTWTLSLTASGTNASDAGSYSVPVVNGNAQPPIVDINSVNPGTFVERGLCLTIAAGAAAASECGDLRIVHALPTTRTMNKARTPTLLYNSQTAHPYPIVAANVTLPSTAAVPDSVTAILTIGGVTRARSQWLGSQWASVKTLRVALGFDALGDGTGVYAYTLEVRNWYPDPTPSQPTTVTAELVVVNRSNSSVGAGWWLAGLEQFFWLPDGRKLVVLGDGSARVYSSVGGNLYTAANPTRPDTLDGTGVDYVRRAPNGVRVHFSATTGKHISTINRLGHQTIFAYDQSCGRLSTITVPPGGSGSVYTFTYASPTDCATRLASVTAPGDRTTNLTNPSGQVTAISDPDNRGVGFGYDPGFANRMISRTDRRGSTTFYAFDAGSRLTTDSLPLGTGQTPIVQRIRPVESFGLATAVDTAVATTRVDGPRVDVADTTAFWLDRFGAPRRLRNALGHETILTRGDARWPALVTRVRYPNGRVDGAAYDGRGNLTEATDSSHFDDRLVVPPCPQGPPCLPGTMVRLYATTRYTWDTKWDFVTSVVRPEKDSIVMAYDATTGNRLWQQAGPDSVRRVRFHYGNGLGLLSSDSLPNTPRDSIEYDGMGNVAVVRTPKRFDTRYTHDVIGRDTMVQVRLDTLVGTPTYQVTVTRYDVLDRDTLQISAGPALGGASAETLFVRKRYNNAGQLDSLSRWSRPAVTSVGTITTRWKYDTAGRVIAEIAPDQFRDSMFYDAAGNDTLTVTRRRDRIAMSYDALNRLSLRRLPGDSFPSDTSAIHNDMGSGLPRSYDPYVILPDTQTFTYDSVGNIRTARNGDARVTRTYFPNGLLASDNLVIRTVQGWDSTKHVYSVSHVYDLDGRQTQLNVPSQLGTSGQTDVTYAYDPQLGLLTSVSDLMDSVYTFTYTLRNERATQRFPSSPYLERFGYDADGRLAADTILNQARNPVDTVRSNRFWYDAANRLLKRVDRPGMYDTLNLSYSGLGHLGASNLVQYAGLMQSCTFTKHTVNETFSYDALGNRAHAQSTEAFTASACGNFSDERFSAYDGTTGRMTQDEIGGQFVTFSYDSAGNQRFSQSLVGPEVERASYFGADGRVRAIDSRTSYGNFATWTRAFDEYRYDALGRRIWVRSRKSCYVATFNPPFGGECSTSLLRRTVWDGDQILAEIQMPGGDTTRDTPYWENDTAAVSLPWFQNNGDQDPSRYFGRVVYTHAGAIDQPLSIARYQYVHALDDNWARLAQPLVIPRAGIMPFWNAQGDAPLGAFHDGNLRFCLTPTTNCEGVAWPFKWSAYDRQRGPVSDNWQGSILEGGRDKSGLDFKRNRLYDPQTGRFTQEDPIGLAGGLNLYGFAAGDPVNFSDPFGLCPPETPWTPECDKPLEDPGLLDPVAWLAGGLAGGLRAFGARLFGRAVVTAAADATVETVANTATRSALNLATKSAARTAVTDLGLTEAQASAANSAIARATTKSTIDLIRQSTGELIVNITRAGRNGFQVMQSVISPNGAKKVTQYFADQAGKVFADPKNW